MDSVVDRAVDLLVGAGVHLEEGLTRGELAAIEQGYGFTFCGIHRRLLARVLPVDDRGHASGWPDWRSAAPEDLQRRLAWPIDSVLFDVVHADFWLHAWGPRPGNGVDAQHVAREWLSRLPPMVPIYGHRYLPSQPCVDDPPVLSIYQTDVIVYGDNLLDYLTREFRVGEPSPQAIDEERRIPFWSDLTDT